MSKNNTYCKNFVIQIFSYSSPARERNNASKKWFLVIQHSISFSHKFSIFSFREMLQYSLAFLESPYLDTKLAISTGSIERTRTKYHFFEGKKKKNANLR